MSYRHRRLALHALFASLVLIVSTAHAQSTPPSADFDTVPEGPWFDPLFFGSPDDMSVLDVANAATLYPYALPTAASGRVLRVDNSSSSANIDVILRFAYNCTPGDQTSTCRVSYGLVGWTFTDGRGIEVFIDDDGSYTTPVFAWQGSIGTAEIEDSIITNEFHDTINCTSDHILDIVVQGGALLILDNVLAECVTPVPNERQRFGTLKSWFE